MSTIILISIIILGISVLRFCVGAVMVVLTGMAGPMKNKAPWWLRLLNVIEVVGMTYGYVVLVLHFYA